MVAIRIYGDAENTYKHKHNLKNNIRKNCY